ncbi:MAG: hypothetical protein WBL95_17050 [Microcoleus sp.]
MLKLRIRSTRSPFLTKLPNYTRLSITRHHARNIFSPNFCPPKSLAQRKPIARSKLHH